MKTFRFSAWVVILALTLTQILPASVWADTRDFDKRPTLRPEGAAGKAKTGLEEALSGLEEPPDKPQGGKSLGETVDLTRVPAIYPAGEAVPSFSSEKTVLVTADAGKGTRFQRSGGKELKVIAPVGGLPAGVRTKLAAQGLGWTVVSVVGFEKEAVMKAYGDHASGIVYVVAENPAGGTGYAIYHGGAAAGLKDSDATVIATMGDQPLYDKKVLEEVEGKFRGSGADLVIATAIFPDATGKGRIVRDGEGKILGILEQKDIEKGATLGGRSKEALLAIREGNVSIYAAKARTLFGLLARIRNDGAQGQFYITDIVRMVLDGGGAVEAVQIEPGKAPDLTTVDDLHQVEEYLAGRTGLEEWVGQVDWSKWAQATDPDSNLIQSFSGIRAVVGEEIPLPVRGPLPEAEISPHHKLIFARYAYDYAFHQLGKLMEGFPGQKSFTLIIGRDPRPSGRAVFEAQARGMLAAAKVLKVKLTILDAGIMPTPFVEALVRRRKAHGGVVITASHNPLLWNGVKYLTAFKEPEGALVYGGILLPSIQMKGIIEKFKAWALAAPSFPQEVQLFRAQLNEVSLQGNVEVVDPQEALEAAFQEARRMWGLEGQADLEAFRKAAGRIKIVVDPNGGAASGHYARFLKTFGFSVKEINGTVGQPSHRLEPVEEALKDAKETLAGEVMGDALQEKAEGLAIITDFDADRANTLLFKPASAQPVVEPNPQEVSALNVAVALSEARLDQDRNGSDKRPLAVVVHDATSRRVWEIAKVMGAELFVAEVGEVNVLEKMRSLEGEGYRVAIGVEGANGGTIFRGDDPVFQGDTCRNGSMTGLVWGMVAAMPEIAQVWLGARSRWFKGSSAGEPPFEATGSTLVRLLNSLPGERAQGNWRFETPIWKQGAPGEIPENLVVRFKQALEEEWYRRIWPGLKAEGFSDFQIIHRAGVAESKPYGPADRPQAASLGDLAHGGWTLELVAPKGQHAFVWLRGSMTEGLLRVETEGQGPSAKETAEKLMRVFQENWYPAALAAAGNSSGLEEKKAGPGAFDPYGPAFLSKRPEVRFFGTDGVAGSYVESYDLRPGVINPMTAYRVGIGAGLLALSAGKPRVAVGMDPRSNSTGLAMALLDGLKKVGAEPVLIGDKGVVSRPALLEAAADVGAGAGVYIGSDRPFPGNRINLFDQTGRPLNQEWQDRVERILRADNLRGVMDQEAAGLKITPLYQEIRDLTTGLPPEDPKAVEGYFNRLLPAAKRLFAAVEISPEKPAWVTVDLAHGAGFFAAPVFMERLKPLVDVRFWANAAPSDSINSLSGAGYLDGQRAEPAALFQLPEGIREEDLRDGILVAGDGTFSQIQAAALTSSRGRKVIADGDMLAALYATFIMEQSKALDLGGDLRVAVVRSPYQDDHAQEYLSRLGVQRTEYVKPGERYLVERLEKGLQDSSGGFDIGIGFEPIGNGFVRFNENARRIIGNAPDGKAKEALLALDELHRGAVGGDTLRHLLSILAMVRSLGRPGKQAGDLFEGMYEPVFRAHRITRPIPNPRAVRTGGLGYVNVVHPKAPGQASAGPVSPIDLDLTIGEILEEHPYPDVARVVVRPSEVAEGPVRVVVLGTDSRSVGKAADKVLALVDGLKELWTPMVAEEPNYPPARRGAGLEETELPTSGPSERFTPFLSGLIAVCENPEAHEALEQIRARLTERASADSALAVLAIARQHPFPGEAADELISGIYHLVGEPWSQEGKPQFRAGAIERLNPLTFGEMKGRWWYSRSVFGEIPKDLKRWATVHRDRKVQWIGYVEPATPLTPENLRWAPVEEFGAPLPQALQQVSQKLLDLSEPGEGPFISGVELKLADSDRGWIAVVIPSVAGATQPEGSAAGLEERPTTTTSPSPTTFWIDVDAEEGTAEISAVVPTVTVPPLDKSKILILGPEALFLLKILPSVQTKDGGPIPLAAVARDAGQQAEAERQARKMGIAFVKPVINGAEFKGGPGAAVVNLQIEYLIQGLNPLAVYSTEALLEAARFLGVPKPEAFVRAAQGLLDREIELFY